MTTTKQSWFKRSLAVLLAIKTTPKGRGMNDKPYKGIIPAAPKGAQ